MRKELEEKSEDIKVENITFIGEHPSKPIHYTECWCNSPYHSIRWYINDYDETKKPHLSFELFLNPNNSLWTRIKQAFNYILKRGDYAGSFDEFEIQDQDLSKLKSIISDIENDEKIK